jgi:DNA-binding transcriptional MerR regulator
MHQEDSPPPSLPRRDDADRLEPALYSIGVVSRMVGVPVSTLRTWEERYGLVIAVRSSGGQRRYTRNQLAQLSFVVEQIEQGFSPGDAHRLLAEHSDRDAGPVLAGAEEQTGILILIAERDRFAAGLEDYLLRTEGFRVEIASSADEAQRKFHEFDPHIVVVELLLSGGVGGQLIERLKEAGATVIAVSPLAACEAAAEFGAAAFLQKPIDPLVFVSTIRDLLGTSAITRPHAIRR